MKPEDDDAKAGMGAGSIGLGDLEANRESRDIFSRERVWRNRTTILQASAFVVGQTLTNVQGDLGGRIPVLGTIRFVMLLWLVGS